MALNGSSITINGTVYYQHPRGRKKTDYCYGNQYFETEEEVLIAEMLGNMNISFIHHVNFIFNLREGDQHSVIWCPDFVFAKPWRWVGDICNGSVIMGLEVKRSCIRGKPRSRSKSLLRELGIPILLVARSHVEPYYINSCRLPLKPLKS
ncbi:hypothetical protein IID19_01235 [Patescibacteria group bacterium]|nr:hypothetical protein [Patescibacteria group bacterium]